MTSNDAFNTLEEAIETAGTSSYDTIEEAFVQAARALNQIMDNVENLDGSENTASD